MRKYIITIIFALGLGMSLNAQKDGFFTYTDYDADRSFPLGAEAPGIPNIHGLSENYQLAETPLGSGFLILGGLALGYAVRKKNRNPDLS